MPERARYDWEQIQKLTLGRIEIKNPELADFVGVVELQKNRGLFKWAGVTLFLGRQDAFLVFRIAYGTMNDPSGGTLKDELLDGYIWEADKLSQAISSLRRKLTPSGARITDARGNNGYSLTLGLPPPPVVPPPFVAHDEAEDAAAGLSDLAGGVVDPPRGSDPAVDAVLPWLAASTSIVPPPMYWAARSGLALSDQSAKAAGDADDNRDVPGGREPIPKLEEAIVAWAGATFPTPLQAPRGLGVLRSDRPWLITGPRCSGRTTLLSAVAARLRNLGKRALLFSAPDLLARLRVGLRPGVAAVDAPGAASTFSALTDVVILVDDLDRLTDLESRSELLEWLRGALATPTHMLAPLLLVGGSDDPPGAVFGQSASMSEGLVVVHLLPLSRTQQEELVEHYVPEDSPRKRVLSGIDAIRKLVAQQEAIDVASCRPLLELPEYLLGLCEWLHRPAAYDGHRSLCRGLRVIFERLMRRARGGIASQGVEVAEGQRCTALRLLRRLALEAWTSPNSAVPPLAPPGQTSDGDEVVQDLCRRLGVLKADGVRTAFVYPLWLRFFAAEEILSACRATITENAETGREVPLLSNFGPEHLTLLSDALALASPEEGATLVAAMLLRLAHLNSGRSGPDDRFRVRIESGRDEKLKLLSDEVSDVLIESIQAVLGRETEAAGTGRRVIEYLSEPLVWQRVTLAAGGVWTPDLFPKYVHDAALVLNDYHVAKAEAAVRAADTRDNARWRGRLVRGAVRAAAGIWWPGNGNIQDFLRKREALVASIESAGAGLPAVQVSQALILLGEFRFYDIAPVVGPLLLGFRGRRLLAKTIDLLHGQLDEPVTPGAFVVAWGEWGACCAGRWTPPGLWLQLMAGGASELDDQIARIDLFYFGIRDRFTEAACGAVWDLMASRPEALPDEVNEARLLSLLESWSSAPRNPLRDRILRRALVELSELLRAVPVQASPASAARPISSSKRHQWDRSNVSRIVGYLRSLPPGDVDRFAAVVDHYFEINLRDHAAESPPSWCRDCPACDCVHEHENVRRVPRTLLTGPTRPSPWRDLGVVPAVSELAFLRRLTLFSLVIVAVVVGLDILAAYLDGADLRQTAARIVHNLVVVLSPVAIAGALLQIDLGRVLYGTGLFKVPTPDFAVATDVDIFTWLAHREAGHDVRISALQEVRRRLRFGDPATGWRTLFGHRDREGVVPAELQEALIRRTRIVGAGMEAELAALCSDAEIEFHTVLNSGTLKTAGDLPPGGSVDRCKPMTVNLLSPRYFVCVFVPCILLAVLSIRDEVFSVVVGVVLLIAVGFAAVIFRALRVRGSSSRPDIEWLAFWTGALSASSAIIFAILLSGSDAAALRGEQVFLAVPLIVVAGVVLTHIFVRLLVAASLPEHRHLWSEASRRWARDFGSIVLVSWLLMFATYLLFV